MTKPMMDLPMNTKSETCGCGGPPKTIETECPHCGQKGMRVRAGTVRYLLFDSYRDEVKDKIYGLCLTPDCMVSWYAQDGTHHFKTSQTMTQIWTKEDADPVYVCYCHEITRQMISDAIAKKGLRTIEEIINHYYGEMKCSCATNNPSGQCCFENFEKIIAEELKDYLGCSS
ncbi:(2Fe-2S)-binding protein [Pseudodesulfovibrio sp. zrk46]|uniref:(2Fe-2S)-binding protein n=1 Tax=Pseudodesulfovibrio sp. zrk46 TaxID=2725288 RepID=UPI001449615A|nr:(2Fe-2S)-binding protein [Pseudodesulfovibrio sp. zrk46]QJB56420.1 (2Fe-2S)-binding protein [Pseudodesulfovibrio sp. zrk46]